MADDGAEQPMEFGDADAQPVAPPPSVVADPQQPGVEGAVRRPTDHNATFLRAARAGNLDQVLEFLRNGININTSNSNGLNALHLASKEGHNEVVRELIRRGADVDAATRKGNTALHIASLAGQDIIVTILVENGANLNAQSLNGFSPLYMAAQENHEGVVRYLLSHGANQALATEDGFTPLAVALQQGHDRVVALLLENDSGTKVKLPALHIAAKKDDTRAATLLLQSDQNPNVTSKSGFTPLHIASHYGNQHVASLLIERGANVNYQARHNISPLHVAAKWGRVDLVKLLLDNGAIIDCRTRDLLTPLHCAARSGHELVVDLLLERGAPIGAKTKNGLAPLHMASQGDHVDCARNLLYHQAAVDDVTVDYLTPLHVAAHCGHVQAAKLLLDRNADANSRALNGFTPLHIACKKNRIKVVELLLKYYAAIEATTESGLSPLHVASFMGCINIVIYLIQQGAKVDVETVRGETPLHLAARANQTDIVRVLVRNGAKVDAQARELQTPLHIASRLGNTDIVHILLNAHANPNAASRDEYTALHIAAKEDKEDVAQILLDHKANKTALTRKGFTPLHLASKYGNYGVARLLLDRGTPVDIEGKNQVTPLHVAAHYNNDRIAQLLLERGAGAQTSAKNGYTPLHIAAKKNQMEIASSLLSYKADPNATSKAGFTPLHLAAESGHAEMSGLLIENGSVPNAKANNGLTPLHLCAQEDKVEAARVLLANRAEVNAQTKAGYTPLHVACHFGQLNMVRLLIEHGALVSAETKAGYTPLHQAAQQGHNTVVRYLLESGASPNSKTANGQTPLSIAQRLGYVSVVETLKTVTETTVITETTTVTEERYKPQNPERMNETMFSDSEDEADESQQAAADEHARDFNESITQGLKDSAVIHLIHTGEQSKMSPFDTTDADLDAVIKRAQAEPVTTAIPDPSFLDNSGDDNIVIVRDTVQPSFLISFLVDARGGAMRGCRHSGVRVIIPPRKAAAPMRITCRYLRKEKLAHPPPLSEGEALASRILEMGPHSAKFLGPVVLEVPHFASLRGREREIVILRSDDGQHWKEHQLEATEDAVQEVLNESFDAAELQQLDDLHSSRITRILTNDFPMYFAVVTRVRQEVHCVGPEGGVILSSVVPRVQAIFPDGSLTKTIKVSLQAQPVPHELVTKLHGNRVAVSPIVTVEPRRRKFHKPITLCIPLPASGNKAMLTQYSAQPGQEPPTLRLLCSITGGSSPAQWEDITGTTQLTFTGEEVSFTTTVSARFWLMDCQTPREAARMAQEVYNEAIAVPYMAKFVVFARRPQPVEGQLRLFCMTDDKEDKTLEKQEQFSEVAKSRDVEVLANRHQFLEFAGNLVPITKSGEQLAVFFLPFQENRLAFNVKVRQHDDQEAATAGRIAIMKEARIRSENIPPQHPICTLAISLPDYQGQLPPLRQKAIVAPIAEKYAPALSAAAPDGELGTQIDYVTKKIGGDWMRLSRTLGVPDSDTRQIKREMQNQEPLTALRIWLFTKGDDATVPELHAALRRIGRDDIVHKLQRGELDSDSLRLIDSSQMNIAAGSRDDLSAAKSQPDHFVQTRTERHVHKRHPDAVQPVVDERTITRIIRDGAPIEEVVSERRSLALNESESEHWLRDPQDEHEAEQLFHNSREAMIVTNIEETPEGFVETQTLVTRHVIPEGAAETAAQELSLENGRPSLERSPERDEPTPEPTRNEHLLVPQHEAPAEDSSPEQLPTPVGYGPEDGEPSAEISQPEPQLAVESQPELIEESHPEPEVVEESQPEPSEPIEEPQSEPIPESPLADAPEPREPSSSAEPPDVQMTDSTAEERTPLIESDDFQRSHTESIHQRESSATFATPSPQPIVEETVVEPMVESSTAGEEHDSSPAIHSEPEPHRNEELPNPSAEAKTAEKTPPKEPEPIEADEEALTADEVTELLEDPIEPLADVAMAAGDLKAESEPTEAVENPAEPEEPIADTSVESEAVVEPPNAAESAPEPEEAQPEASDPMPEPSDPNPPHPHSPTLKRQPTDAENAELESMLSDYGVEAEIKAPLSPNERRITNYAEELTISQPERPFPVAAFDAHHDPQLNDPEVLAAVLKEESFEKDEVPEEPMEEKREVEEVVEPADGIEEPKNENFEDKSDENKNEPKNDEEIIGFEGEISAENPIEVDESETAAEHIPEPIEAQPAASEPMESSSPVFEDPAEPTDPHSLNDALSEPTEFHTAAEALPEPLNSEQSASEPKNAADCLSEPIDFQSAAENPPEPSESENPKSEPLPAAKSLQLTNRPPSLDEIIQQLSECNQPLEPRGPSRPVESPELIETPEIRALDSTNPEDPFSAETRDEDLYSSSDQLDEPWERVDAPTIDTPEPPHRLDVAAAGRLHLVTPQPNESSTPGALEVRVDEHGDFAQRLTDKLTPLASVSSEPSWIVGGVDSEGRVLVMGLRAERGSDSDLNENEEMELEPNDGIENRTEPEFEDLAQEKDLTQNQGNDLEQSGKEKSKIEEFEDLERIYDEPLEAEQPAEDPVIDAESANPAIIPVELEIPTEALIESPRQVEESEKPENQPEIPQEPSEHRTFPAEPILSLKSLRSPANAEQNPADEPKSPQTLENLADEAELAAEAILAAQTSLQPQQPTRRDTLLVEHDNSLSTEEDILHELAQLSVIQEVSVEEDPTVATDRTELAAEQSIASDSTLPVAVPMQQSLESENPDTVSFEFTAPPQKRSLGRAPLMAEPSVEEFGEVPLGAADPMHSFGEFRAARAVVEEPKAAKSPLEAHRSTQSRIRVQEWQPMEQVSVDLGDAEEPLLMERRFKVSVESRPLNFEESFESDLAAKLDEPIHKESILGDIPVEVMLAEAAMDLEQRPAAPKTPAAFPLDSGANELDNMDPEPRPITPTPPAAFPTDSHPSQSHNPQSHSQTQIPQFHTQLFPINGGLTLSGVPLIAGVSHQRADSDESIQIDAVEVEPEEFFEPEEEEEPTQQRPESKIGVGKPVEILPTLSEHSEPLVVEEDDLSEPFELLEVPTEAEMAEAGGRKEEAERETAILDDNLEEEQRVAENLAEEPKIAEVFVEEPKIADNFVEEPKIADKFVEEPKIAEEPIPEPKTAEIQIEAPKSTEIPAEATKPTPEPQLPSEVPQFADIPSAESPSPSNPPKFPLDSIDQPNGPVVADNRQPLPDEQWKPRNDQTPVPTHPIAEITPIAETRRQPDRDEGGNSEQRVAPIGMMTAINEENGPRRSGGETEPPVAAVGGGDDRGAVAAASGPQRTAAFRVADDLVAAAIAPIAAAFVGDVAISRDPAVSHTPPRMAAEVFMSATPSPPSGGDRKPFPFPVVDIARPDALLSPHDRLIVQHSSQPSAESAYELADAQLVAEEPPKTAEESVEEVAAQRRVCLVPATGGWPPEAPIDEALRVLDAAVAESEQPLVGEEVPVAAKPSSCQEIAQAPPQSDLIAAASPQSLPIAPRAEESQKPLYEPLQLDTSTRPLFHGATGPISPFTARSRTPSGSRAAPLLTPPTSTEVSPRKAEAPPLRQHPVAAAKPDRRSAELFAALLNHLRRLKMSNPPEYENIVQRLHALESEMSLVNSGVPPDPQLTDLVSRVLTADYPDADLQIVVSTSRKSTSTTQFYETETPGMVGLSPEQLRELQQKLMTNISGAADFGSSADRSDQPADLKRRDATEEGWTTADGTEAVHKKSFRQTTTSYSGVTGAEGHEPKDDSDDTSSTSSSVRDRIQRFEHLKQEQKRAAEASTPPKHSTRTEIIHEESSQSPGAAAMIAGAAAAAAASLIGARGDETPSAASAQTPEEAQSVHSLIEKFSHPEAAERKPPTVEEIHERESRSEEVGAKASLSAEAMRSGIREETPEERIEQPEHRITEREALTSAGTEQRAAEPKEFPAEPIIPQPEPTEPHVHYQQPPEAQSHEIQVESQIQHHRIESQEPTAAVQHAIHEDESQQSPAPAVERRFSMSRDDADAIVVQPAPRRVETAQSMESEHEPAEYHEYAPESGEIAHHEEPRLEFATADVRAHEVEVREPREAGFSVGMEEEPSERRAEAAQRHGIEEPFIHAAETTDPSLRSLHSEGSPIQTRESPEETEEPSIQTRETREAEEKEPIQTKDSTIGLGTIAGAAVGVAAAAASSLFGAKEPDTVAETREQRERSAEAEETREEQREAEKFAESDLELSDEPKTREFAQISKPEQRKTESKQIHESELNEPQHPEAAQLHDRIHIESHKSSIAEAQHPAEPEAAEAHDQIQIHDQEPQRADLESPLEPDVAHIHDRVHTDAHEPEVAEIGEPLQPDVANIHDRVHSEEAPATRDAQILELEGAAPVSTEPIPNRGSAEDLDAEFEGREFGETLGTAAIRASPSDLSLRSDATTVIHVSSEEREDTSPATPASARAIDEPAAVEREETPTEVATPSRVDESRDTAERGFHFEESESIESGPREADAFGSRPEEAFEIPKEPREEEIHTKVSESSATGAEPHAAEAGDQQQRMGLGTMIVGAAAMGAAKLINALRSDEEKPSEPSGESQPIAEESEEHKHVEFEDPEFYDGQRRRLSHEEIARVEATPIIEEKTEEFAEAAAAEIEADTHQPFEPSATEIEEQRAAEEGAESPPATPEELRRSDEVAEPIEETKIAEKSESISEPAPEPSAMVELIAEPSPITEPSPIAEEHHIAIAPIYSKAEGEDITHPQPERSQMLVEETEVLEEPHLERRSYYETEHAEPESATPLEPRSPAQHDDGHFAYEDLEEPIAEEEETRESMGLGPMVVGGIAMGALAVAERLRRESAAGAEEVSPIGSPHEASIEEERSPRDVRGRESPKIRAEAAHEAEFESKAPVESTEHSEAAEKIAEPDPTPAVNAEPGRVEREGHIVSEESPKEPGTAPAEAQPQEIAGETPELPASIAESPQFHTEEHFQSETIQQHKAEHHFPQESESHETADFIPQQPVDSQTSQRIEKSESEDFVDNSARQLVGEAMGSAESGHWPEEPIAEESEEHKHVEFEDPEFYDGQRRRLSHEEIARVEATPIIEEKTEEFAEAAAAEIEADTHQPFEPSATEIEEQRAAEEGPESPPATPEELRRSNEVAEPIEEPKIAETSAAISEPAPEPSPSAKPTESQYFDEPIQQHPTEPTESQIEEAESPDRSQQMGIGTMVLGAAYLAGKAVVDKIKSSGDREPHGYEEISESYASTPSAEGYSQMIESQIAEPQTPKASEFEEKSDTGAEAANRPEFESPKAETQKTEQIGQSGDSRDHPTDLPTPRDEALTTELVAATPDSPRIQLTEPSLDSQADAESAKAKTAEIEEQIIEAQSPEADYPTSEPTDAEIRHYRDPMQDSVYESSDAVAEALADEQFEASHPRPDPMQQSIYGEELGAESEPAEIVESEEIPGGRDPMQESVYESATQPQRSFDQESVEEFASQHYEASRPTEGIRMDAQTAEMGEIVDSAPMQSFEAETKTVHSLDRVESEPIGEEFETRAVGSFDAVDSQPIGSFDAEFAQTQEYRRRDNMEPHPEADEPVESQPIQSFDAFTASGPTELVDSAEVILSPERLASSRRSYESDDEAQLRVEELVESEEIVEPAAAELRPESPHSTSQPETKVQSSESVVGEELSSLVPSQSIEEQMSTRTLSSVRPGDEEEMDFETDAEIIESESPTTDSAHTALPIRVGFDATAPIPEEETLSESPQSADADLEFQAEEQREEVEGIVESASIPQFEDAASMARDEAAMRAHPHIGEGFVESEETEEQSAEVSGQREEPQFEEIIEIIETEPLDSETGEIAAQSHPADSKIHSLDSETVESTEIPAEPSAPEPVAIPQTDAMIESGVVESEDISPEFGDQTEIHSERRQTIEHFGQPSTEEPAATVEDVIVESQPIADEEFQRIESERQQQLIGEDIQHPDSYPTEYRSQYGDPAEGAAEETARRFGLGTMVAGAAVLGAKAIAEGVQELVRGRGQPEEPPNYEERHYCDQFEGEIVESQPIGEIPSQRADESQPPPKSPIRRDSHFETTAEDILVESSPVEERQQRQGRAQPAEAELVLNEAVEMTEDEQMGLVDSGEVPEAPKPSETAQSRDLEVRERRDVDLVPSESVDRSDDPKLESPIPAESETQQPEGFTVESQPIEGSHFYEHSESTFTKLPADEEVVESEEIPIEAGEPTPATPKAFRQPAEESEADKIRKTEAEEEEIVCEGDVCYLRPKQPKTVDEGLVASESLETEEPKSGGAVETGFGQGHPAEEEYIQSHPAEEGFVQSQEIESAKPQPIGEIQSGGIVESEEIQTPQISTPSEPASAKGFGEDSEARFGKSGEPEPKSEELQQREDMDTEPKPTESKAEKLEPKSEAPEPIQGDSHPSQPSAAVLSPRNVDDEIEILDTADFLTEESHPDFPHEPYLSEPIEHRSKIEEWEREADRTIESEGPMEGVEEPAAEPEPSPDLRDEYDFVPEVEIELEVEEGTPEDGRTISEAAGALSAQPLATPTSTPFDTDVAISTAASDEELTRKLHSVRSEELEADAAEESRRQAEAAEEVKTPAQEPPRPESERIVESADSAASGPIELSGEATAEEPPAMKMDYSRIIGEEFRSESAGTDVSRDREFTRDDFGGDEIPTVAEMGDDEQPTVEIFDEGAAQPQIQAPGEVDEDEEAELAGFQVVHAEDLDEVAASSQLGVEEPTMRPHSPIPPRWDSSAAMQPPAAAPAAEEAAAESAHSSPNASLIHVSTTSADAQRKSDGSESSLLEFERLELELAKGGEEAAGDVVLPSTLTTTTLTEMIVTTSGGEEHFHSDSMQQSVGEALTGSQIDATDAQLADMAASGTGSLNSLAEFENLERELLDAQQQESAAAEAAAEVMILSDIREESGEELSLNDTDSLSHRAAAAIAARMAASADSLEPVAAEQMLTSVDSLEQPQPRAHAMDTSVDSLEPLTSAPATRHADDSLLDEGTSGGQQSQDTHAGLSCDTAGTFQEYREEEDRDSLEGVIDDYPTTLTTFETIQTKEDGSTETITRRVLTRVTDPVHSHVVFTGTESEDRLRNIEPEARVESVDEEGNITTTVRRRTPTLP